MRAAIGFEGWRRRSAKTDDSVICRSAVYDIVESHAGTQELHRAQHSAGWEMGGFKEHEVRSVSATNPGTECVLRMVTSQGREKIMI